MSKKKRILLLTDDIRAFSGVGIIGREIVTQTANKYDWVNLGCIPNHPDKGKVLDLSKDIDKKMGYTDSYVKVYPYENYGDKNVLMYLLKQEQIDAIFVITDPRYFEWLFQIEAEVRKFVPIIYLNIWDNYPAPMYNREYYMSCDALLSISRLTYDINNLVLGEEAKNKIIKYIPHGLDHNLFKPLDKKDINLIKFKNQILKNQESDFILFFNSKNISRKNIPDMMVAWTHFMNSLPEHKSKKCYFILHTDPQGKNGNDLLAIRDLFGPKDYNIIFDDIKRSTEEMNMLYNIADGTILVSTAEGWGLSLTESLLAGTPIIGGVSGGMQDQMGFFNKEGDWDKYCGVDNSGSWVYPVFPITHKIVGSLKTPYIYDTHYTVESITEKISSLYNTNKEQRDQYGLGGRNFALDAGLTSEIMSQKVSDAIEETFTNFTPRERYIIMNTNDFKPKYSPHTI